MNAVIYARFSCSKQREESIEGQIRMCTEYAKRNGIEIVGTYIDRAKSARTDKRPQFRKMAEDSDSGLFDAILVWKLDRFSRNQIDSAVYKKLLSKNKIKILSATENIPEDASGIMLIAVLEGMAEYYSADLSEKVLRGHHENALKCKSNGGTLPFGYMLDCEKHFIINPNTAPYVLSAFQMYAEGITMKEIANNLNFKGVLNTRGTKFTINSVSKMLSNIRYTGLYKYREIEKPDGIPRIVPDELFNSVQELMAKNKKAPAKHKAEDDYLLTTKLFCGSCKSLMVGESGTSKNSSVYRYYKCTSAKKTKTCDKRAIKKDWIENIVIDKIVAVLWDDELIEKVTKRIMKLQKEENTTLVTLQKQLSETNRGINNMLNAIQQGIITDASKDRLNELETTKRNIETEITKEQIKHAPITEEQIRFWFEGFRSYDITKLEYRKRLVDAFVNSIIVFDDRIEFYFNYRDGVETLSLKDLDKCSDLVDPLRPKTSRSLRALACFSL